MVIDILTSPGWGGLAFALDFIEEKFLEKNSSPKNWAIIEASASTHLYPPSLSRDTRQALSLGVLFWLHCPEEQAPEVAQILLESGRFQGILIRGLENFSRATPAALWGRRWQLAAHKSGTHLLWIHRKPQTVLGFDVRLEWNAPGSFEMKKGFGHLESLQLWKSAS